MQKIVFLLCIVQSLYCYPGMTVKEFTDIEYPKALQVLKQKVVDTYNNFDYKLKSAVTDIDKFEKETAQKHSDKDYFAHLFTLMLNNGGNNRKGKKIEDNLIHPATVMGEFLKIFEKNPDAIYKEIKTSKYPSDDLNHALGHIIMRKYNQGSQHSICQAS